MTTHTRPLCAAALLLVGSAQAYDSGDWLLRGGAHYVEPKSNNHGTVSVDGAASITASLSYFFTPNLAVDVLAAIPFEHDITLNGDGSTVASTMHLPPTVSMVWYPSVAGNWQPFVGAGLNYTLFFEEETKGALDGSKLSLDPSVGLAAVAGMEYRLQDNLTLSLDVRYFDIDTDASLDGADLGSVEIDPMGYGLSLGYQF